MLAYTTTGGLEKFLGAYRKALTDLVTNEPDKVGWPVTELPVVLARMERAFRDGAFNHDGEGIKRACKALGIKFTRKAILEYMKGSGEVDAEKDEVDAERAFEMRAAFGPGEEVVNILTGKRYRT